MGRRILSVPLGIALDALCRDDRKRASESGDHPFVTCDGVPDDARIVGVLADSAFSGMLELVIESEEFKPDPPGCALTRIAPMFTCYKSYLFYLVASTDKAKKCPPADAPIFSGP